MAQQQSCRNCKWLVPKHDKNGKPRVVRTDTYLCNWPMPAIALPDSITKQHRFNSMYEHHIRMSPTDGTECPAWESKMQEASK